MLLPILISALDSNNNIYINLHDNLVRAHLYLPFWIKLEIYYHYYNQWLIIGVNPIISDYQLSNLSWFPGFSIRAGGRWILPAISCELTALLFFGNYPPPPPPPPKSQNVMMSVVCSNTLIFAPECWKCTLRGPDFNLWHVALQSNGC